MPQIISIHSFSRGVGKSNLIANVATLLAQDGRAVGLVDANFLQPSLHILFGVDDSTLDHSLNDFAHGDCELAQAAYDITARLGAPVQGRLILIPASTRPADIMRILREGYSAERLNDGFQQVIRDNKLDVLMVDAHAGINEDVLISIAISDALGIVLRMDRQNYQSTAVMVEVARRLQIPRVGLIVNQVRPSLDLDEVRRNVEKAYGCPVAAVLPHSEEFMTVASAAIFAVRYPHHPLTASLQEIAARLMQ